MAETNLKPGWRKVKFGHVVRLSKLRSADPQADGYDRFVGLDHLDPGDLRIRRWGNVADGVTFTSVFMPGQVLFGKRRAYQRKVGVADFSGVCSGDIYVLESIDATVLLPDLLPFICQSDDFFDHAVGTSAGSLSPRTNWTSLADFEFALPSMEEQSRLTNVLRIAAETIQAQEAALHAAQRLVQSLKDNIQQSASHTHYHNCMLVDVLTGSPESGCSAPPRDADTGYFVLGLAALSRNGYRRGDYKPVDPTDKMMAAKLSKGDLLISRSNTPDRVGYAGIFDDDRDDVSFPDTMMRLKPNTQRIEPRYLEVILQTSAAREFLMRIAAGTSASMKKINRANLMKMPIRVPDLETQRATLRELASVTQAIAAIETRRQDSKSLAMQLAAESMSGGR